MNLLEREYKNSLAPRSKKQPRKAKGDIQTRIVKVVSVDKLNAAMAELLQQQEVLKKCLGMTTSLLTEMKGVNVNIHPLRALVLQKWRDELSLQEYLLQQALTKEGASQ